MATNTTANIGFEKQIWDAACVLRGNMDASEYKSVVLGLIFLKYISDRFEAKYNALVEEGDGFEEDKDEYTAENIFFVPENARWKVIAAAAHTPEIGAVIDEAMRSIEKENKRLKDILPKNFARPELDKRRLGEVVDLFTNIQMVEHGDSKDILGRTYEYCLSKFAEQEGKLAGEFYTPACVANLPSRRASSPGNSTPPPVWCARWWKFCSPIMAGFTIPAAAAAACSCSRPSSWRTTAATSTGFPYSARTPTPPPGRWRR